MESFHWGPHYVTGINKVDDEHHHLVDLINRLGDLLTGETRAKTEQLSVLFDELAKYAVHHFKDEERMMSQINIDPRHLRNHIKAHQHFLDEVTSLYAKVSADNPESAKGLLEFLIHWLAYHILGQDQDMAKQIEAIKSGLNPAEAFDKLERERLSDTAPLLEALNGLFVQVTNRNKELKQLNESLEEKVAIRTQELSDLNKHLEELSLTDVLTGLPNRRHAMGVLASLWEQSLKSDLPITCLMIDADHFKEVNDTYGHDAGDEVLKELSNRMLNSIRNDDILCRLGGDEFFIICPNTDREGGMQISEFVRKEVSELRVATGGEPWHGSISVGVGFREPKMKLHDEIIKAADNGVYAAKEAGKNCVRAGN
ncbi:MAG: GGDEF domain-containing protein [Gammaproteobacteria bacterium]|nr:GGDEF domain-containing protein [Gammaproteobacteria bacterium]NNJ72777.1 GGDEF domain-containing protein [Enterobacterales bacterium]